MTMVDDAQNSGAVAGILGGSTAIRGVIELIERVAPTEATVLVTGESGTGKELVARAVHGVSPRREAPFVAVNCAAMPQALLESELFGHLRGAFTDAKQARAGLFLQAGAGTIFLDEIGEIPAEMQVKLLRVLQERVVRPVGGDEETPFKARVVAATNRDLEADVGEGRFRADLYYRINVVQIDVPPLRARRGDVRTLAEHFLRGHVERGAKAVAGISAAAARKLVDYDWPGNVRELENCMERAVALARQPEITVDDLPGPVRDHDSVRLGLDGQAGGDPEEMLTLAEMERRYVRRVVHAVGGNKSRAARILGIDRRSLYRRLETDTRDKGR
jgi:transcriptional regulator with PAS, ATPase and Fis domain